MRFYWPIAKVDSEQRMVWGYASTEALDEQGEIIRREALEAALGDYMRFANIREMHQPSAVGVAKEANVDDKGLYLAAKIIDDEAWEKVVQGVYKGFSIGGRVTARHPADRSVITALTLTEISVVDRPANPDAVFDCWKASDGDEVLHNPVSFDVAKRDWARGDAEHHHHEGDDADGYVRKRISASDGARSKPPTESNTLAGASNHRDFSIQDSPRVTEATESWATADELAKVQGQSDKIVKLVIELSAMVGQIAKQVNDIANTPLPAQTIAYPHGLTGVSKIEDSGRGRTLATDEEIVDHFAKLDPTEQTMLLIKAAYRNPMRRTGKGQTDSDPT
ncbi:MAG: XkdF-like putative serine protease domain-containing protein [Alphaproteobacteria bacterium]